MSNNNQLLRSYVRILMESDGGDYGPSDYYNVGVSRGFGKKISDAFLDPFRTAKASIEKFSVKVQKLAGKIAEFLTSSYDADYERFDKEEKRRLQAINNKYKDLYDRNDAHLFNGDAALMGFLYAPHAFVTAKIAKESPDVALDMLDTLSGDHPEVKNFTDRARKYTNKLSSKGNLGRTAPLEKTDRYRDDYDHQYHSRRRDKYETRRQQKSASRTTDQKVRRHSETVAHTGEVLEEAKDVSSIIAKFANSKQVQAILQNNPTTKNMKRDAESYVKDYVNGFVAMTRKYLETEKSEKLRGILDQRLQGKDEASKQELHAYAKQAVKDRAIKTLEEKIAQLPEGKKHPIAKFYLRGIDVIKKA